jgi:fluoride exporter
LELPSGGVSRKLDLRRARVISVRRAEQLNRMTTPDKTMTYILVALGSMIGGVGRFWIFGLVADRMGQVFPWNTLVVNVTGSFVIGVLGAWTAPDGPLTEGSRAAAMSFLMIGICGGYTTFSSFSLQTLILVVRDKQWLYAGANIVASVVFCLLAVWLGFLLGRLLIQLFSK